MICPSERSPNQMKATAPASSYRTRRAAASTFRCLLAAMALVAAIALPAHADVIGRGVGASPIDLYSNIPVYQVGDLVTIKVNEGITSTVESTQTSGSKTTSSKTFNGLMGLLLPNLNRDVTSTNAQKQSQALTSTLTARVVKVEGTTVQLAASRMVTMDGNKVTLVLQGRARTRDITVDNYLDSTRLADMQLQVAGLKGQKTGDVLQSVYRFLF